MAIIGVLEQVRELLRSKGRITYRVLRLQFNLDNESLDALKDEFIQAERVAADEDGKVLVWIGDREKEETAKGRKGETEVVSFQLPTSNSQPPIAYPPPISPSAFARQLSATASARPSQHCLPISKAQQP